MARTPPTIVAPLPTDPRVMALAKATGLSRREAFAAAAESWAWMLVMAVDDIVANTAPDSLDGLVDVAGFGSAMLQEGLVGTVDGGLVLPAELRHRQHDKRGGRTGAAAEGQDEKAERDRLRARIRQRRLRAGKAMTKPAAKDSAQPPDVGNASQKVNAPRKLGEVEGYPVLLLFSRQGVPFYKLAGASPKEWTGTVTDPENPSYADALAALHAAMKREDGKGFCDGNAFRPSMQNMVTAAERYRDARNSSSAAAARREQANNALLEASAEDRDDAGEGSVERDCHASVTVTERDTVTVTLVSRQNSVTCPPNSNADNDLQSVTCHAPVTLGALSSSSSSVFLGNDEIKTTTTTRNVTPVERDAEDRILERFCPVDDTVARPAEDAGTAKMRRKRNQLLERFAAALGTQADAIDWQWRHEPLVLRARLEAAGIDLATVFPVNAEASGKPADARATIDMTTEAVTQDNPSTGSLEPGGHDERYRHHERDHATLSKFNRIQQSRDTLRSAAALGAAATILKVTSTGQSADAEVLNVVIG
jgi:hypothetical protein